MPAVQSAASWCVCIKANHYHQQGHTQRTIQQQQRSNGCAFTAALRYAVACCSKAAPRGRSCNKNRCSATHLRQRHRWRDMVSELADSGAPLEEELLLRPGGPIVKVIGRQVDVCLDSTQSGCITPLFTHRAEGESILDIAEVFSNLGAQPGVQQCTKANVRVDQQHALFRRPAGRNLGLRCPHERACCHGSLKSTPASPQANSVANTSDHGALTSAPTTVRTLCIKVGPQVSRSSKLRPH